MLVSQSRIHMQHPLSDLNKFTKRLSV